LAGKDALDANADGAKGDVENADVGAMEPKADLGCVGGRLPKADDDVVAPKADVGCAAAEPKAGVGVLINKEVPCVCAGAKALWG